MKKIIIFTLLMSLTSACHDEQKEAQLNSIIESQKAELSTLKTQAESQKHDAEVKEVEITKKLNDAKAEIDKMKNRISELRVKEKTIREINDKLTSDSNATKAYNEDLISALNAMIEGVQEYEQKLNRASDKIYRWRQKIAEANSDLQNVLLVLENTNTFISESNNFFWDSESIENLQSDNSNAIFLTKGVIELLDSLQTEMDDMMRTLDIDYLKRQNSKIDKLMAIRTE